jgi:threonine synthase
MGLPVKQFLAATNANDTVPTFLKSGIYQPKASVQTWSNAMDVGNPSNWVRIMNMFGNDAESLKSVLTGYRFTDDETVYAIHYIFKRDEYVACPHTAIAWMAAQEWKEQHPADAVVFLSTAHPCKFPDIFPPEISSAIQIPEGVGHLESRARVASTLKPDFAMFKEFLLQN